MAAQQCNGFGTLDDFLESLITEELHPDNYQPISHKDNNNASPTTPQEKSHKSKCKPNQLDSPGAMQTIAHGLESPGLPKNNFGMPPSVMYSPPLSPECVPINAVPMTPEDGNVMMFPPQVGPQPHPMQGVDQHALMHAAQQGIPTFIGDKNFEKTYIYDPKPLTRKTRRALVPEEQKNQKYWLKRMRNNVAARKSREDRRRKELEVLDTMKALKDENQKMKNYIDTVVKANEQLVADMMRMKHQLEQYESNAGKVAA